VRRLGLAVAIAALVAPAGALAADTRAVAVKTDAAAIRVFMAQPKVERWLERYPRDRLTTTAHFAKNVNVWKVSIAFGEAGQVAAGRVTREGAVTEAFVGPEVAWPLARGYGLGGKINEPLLWLAFCAVFFFALADFRRPLSLRNLDVGMVLGFSVYLWYFNEGRVFASAIAAAVPLLYFLARCTWIGSTNRAARQPTLLPVWVLVSALVFLVGLRIGLTYYAPTVIDVGYAGVIGADRLADGETPYGNFPVKDTSRSCSLPSADGDRRDWIQSNGRCESANALGDTYGPVAYHAYLPGLALFGWSGLWDNLPAVRFTSILFDLLAILGLAAVGLRYGGTRLAAALALAWAANPFTQYVLSSNTNDAIMPTFLIWGYWAATSSSGRGFFGALAAWTKMASLITVPLWATYPERRGRSVLTFLLAFGVTTVAAFWVIFASGDPFHELRVFYERTFEIQAERTSPFSLWDWGQYHAAGLPDLAVFQRVGQVLLVVAALFAAFFPRRKSPLQLAALTAALLVGFQFLLTHWSGLYVAWFFPFVALACFAGEALGGQVRDRAYTPSVVPPTERSPQLEPASLGPN
jgi:hypothetical protein